MLPAQSINFLQSLRGAQPLVVLAYLMIRRAMTIDELETFTGLDNDTLRKAVKSLAAKGILARQTGRHGRTVWLPAADLLPLDVGIGKQNPKISDSTSSSSSLFPPVPTIREEQEEEEEAPESENFGLCLQTLDAAGIREPKATQLARLEWVTVAYIEAHIKQALSQGHEIGTAIHRIEHNWPIREERSKGYVVPPEYAYLVNHDEEDEGD
jgi:hypothetical protein